MKVKVKMKVLSFLLCAALIGNIFHVNLIAAEHDVYALTYHVGAYDMFPESDGSISVMIDGKKYYYSDDFDDGKIATKLSKMENQNVVYELHNNKIVKVYTMDEVLSQEVTVEPSVKDGLIYRKGKFSQKSFEIVVKVSNNLQGDFQKNDLLWFLSDTEKGCLYSTLKKLEIEPSDKVDFGSSGWWMWKEYEKAISENVNDVIKAEETKEYKYTVNLHNDGVANQKEYNIILYATPTFDTGVGRRVEGKIPVGNLDYQEEKTEEKKAVSNSGQSVVQAVAKLDGIQNAIQFSKDLFSSDQMNHINEFVNIWMSELLLAKYVDKSELKEKVSEKIANELLKKLGLDTSVIAIPGEIRATTYLETKTKDGTKAFIQFNINLLNFDFGNSGMPTMATGSGTAIIYNMDGEELDSSVILPAYANVCAFCEQLQKVAKDTIFNGAKEYLGICGISAEATAEALSTQLMGKILNGQYTKDVFKCVDARDVKAVLKNIISKGEKTCNNKIFKLITTPSQEITEINVKCPVDIKVYDNDGKLCGVIKDNVVDSVYNDIFVSVVGEQKNIYLVGDDYHFELTGTDSGSMDYIVSEYDESGTRVREITYENVKLTKGCKYYAYVPEAEKYDSVLFDLTDNEGNIISPTTVNDEGDNYEVCGKCGDNVFWQLSEEGVLYIYGSGDMYTSIPGSAPNSWYYSRVTDKNKINTVVIEKGVTSIGGDAFYFCENLKSVNIPDSITYIGGCAFYGCKSLKYVEIPDSVTKIAGAAFFECSRLESVEIPDSVTYIGGSAFKFCENLKKINYMGTANQWAEIEFCETYSNPTYYSNDIYINNQLVTELDLTEVSRISDYAFQSCKSLKTVIIGDSVASIGPHAFDNCIGLEKITIGNNVTSIGLLAFYGCENLTKINFTGTIDQWAEIDFEDLNGWRYSNPTIYSKDLYINEQLVTDANISEAKLIGNDAFASCKSLKTVIIGDSVASIGPHAFDNCIGLEKIIIGNNVTSIGAGAFMDCTSLLNVTIPTSVIEMEKSCGLGRTHNNMYGEIEGFVMQGYAGTVAESYAKYWGLKFIDITGEINNPTTQAINQDNTVKSIENPTTQKVETTQHSNTVKKLSSTKIKSIKGTKKSLKLTWKKIKGANGYQIQYSTSSKFQNAKKITIKKTKTTSKTVKKLKSKKKYYVRIRTYITVNGKKKYSKWSKKKSQITK